MKKKILAILTFLYLGLLNAQTITVTKADVIAQYVIGAKTTDKIDTLSREINIGNLGEGNYWDFSSYSLQAHISYDEEIVEPGGTFFAADFPEAEYAVYAAESIAEATGEIWQYVGFPDNTAVHYGYGSVSVSQLGAITAELLSVPAEIGAVFPMTLGTNWTYSGQEIYTIKSGVIPIETNAEVTVTYIVDAAGTLKLPNGKELPALRLYEKREKSIQIAPGITDDEVEILFTFFTKTGEEVSVTLIGDRQQNTGTVTADAILWNDGDGVNAVQISGEIPDEFLLCQNYPNPFNPTTNIVYSIKKAGLVQLKVYDMLGREVRTLVNEYQSQGRYREIFNADGLPSGNYIIQLRSGNYTKVRKMTLLK